MITRWIEGDRVVVAFDGGTHGGPGTVIETGDRDDGILVQIDGGPAVWCAPWECAAPTDVAPEPTPEADGVHDPSRRDRRRGGVMGEHDMTYTAGVAGLGRPLSPHWKCRCGDWRYPAQAMPRRRAGNNKIEAERAYRAHVSSTVDGPSGSGGAAAGKVRR